MGEEKKEEVVASKEEEKKKQEKNGEEEKNKDEEEAPPPQEVVLKVDMHCEACARKVKRALKGLEGVEEVTADYKASKVVVKGKVAAADPSKVCQRIQKKCGRKVELISPLPKPPEEEKNNQENKQADQPPKEETKTSEPPPVVTIVLKVRMHCDACAQALQKRIGKIQGVQSVTTDIANDKVTVKGVLDPEKLVNDVYKKTGKQASVVINEEEKKAEEEKKSEEKKEEKTEETKQEGEEPSNEEDDKKIEIKKSEYWPSKYYMEYAYAPQLFSDENPNACTVM